MTSRRLLPISILLLLCSFASAQVRSAARSAAVPLPLVFEANHGQTARPVRYLAHGGAFTLFLTDSGPVLALGKSGAEPAAVQLRWIGGNPDAAAAGEAPQAGVVNYLVGRDPTEWHTGVPTFARVRYRDLYPGIDVVFHGAQHALEYDVVVKPGSDPRAVSFRIQGARLSLDKEGDLLLHTNHGDLLQHRPVIYQVIDGRKRSVAGGYTLNDGRVSFAVGAYDRRRELVIDPTLAYSTYLGGSQQEWVSSVAVDGSNRAYLLGQTLSSNFPIKNAFQPTRKGNSGFSMFITKFWATGGGLVYSTYFGGECSLGDVAVDRNAAVYFATTCDPKLTPGKIIGSMDMSKQQAVVAKLNPSGTSLAYSLIYGGNDGAFGGTIALDSSFHAYAAGTTDSVNFPTTAGAYRTSLGSESSASFVVKVKADGSGFDYSTYFPQASATSIAVNSSGQAYISGFAGNSLPTTPGAFQTAKPPFNPCDQPCNSDADSFVTKFNAAGSALVYSTYLGGNDEDDGRGLAVDGNGNAYVTGSTFSTNFPTTAGAFQRARQSGSNFSAYVTKLNATGTGLSYSTYLSGSGGAQASSIAVNSLGHAFVTGDAGINFPVKNAIQAGTNGNRDVFVAKLWATGGGLHWATYLGGNNFDFGTEIRLDGAGNAYVVGQTPSTNFPTTPGAYRRNFQGTQDGFLFKITN